MSKELTDKQAAVLAYIVDRYREDGVPPSYRDISEHFEVGQTAVLGHIKGLRRKGYLQESPGHFARTMIPVVPKGHCPCCGQRHLMTDAELKKQIYRYMSRINKDVDPETS